jgi:cytochrome c-type biogenesis protein CcmH
LRGAGRPDGPDSRALLVALYRDELERAESDRRTGALSKDAYESTRREIETRLFDDVDSARPAGTIQASQGFAARAATAGLMVALLPSAALALYLKLGEPRALALALDATPGGQHEMASGTLDVMVSRLALRLRDRSGTADDWAMLARSYFVLDRANDAVAAYARAVALAPRDAQLRADYADALASARGSGLAGSSLEQIDAALALDAANPKALALAGSAALDRRDYAAALDYWQRLANALEPGTAAQTQARRNTDEARSLLAGKTPAASR